MKNKKPKIGTDGLTKQQRYRKKQAAKKLRPATIDVPEHAYDDLMYMAKWLCEQAEKGHKYVPFMARNINSGVFRKCV